MTQRAWSVYLASPIDQSAPWVKETADRIHEALTIQGATVYNPARAWQGFRTVRAIGLVNNTALEACDALMAYLPQGMPSVGVPIEVAQAAKLGKPVYLLGGDNIHSPMWPEGIQRADIDAIGVDEAAWELKQEVLGVNIPTARPKTSEPSLPEYLSQVATEMDRAERKHPDTTKTNGKDRWFSVWMEEVVEACQAWNDGRPDHEVREELVQVGAMAARLWEALL